MGCKLSKFDVTFQIISKLTTLLFLKYIACAFIVTHYMGFLKPYFTCLSVPGDSELHKENTFEFFISIPAWFSPKFKKKTLINLVLLKKFNIDRYQQCKTAYKKSRWHSGTNINLVQNWGVAIWWSGRGKALCWINPPGSSRTLYHLTFKNETENQI